MESSDYLTNRLFLLRQGAQCIIPEAMAREMWAVFDRHRRSAVQAAEAQCAAVARAATAILERLDAQQESERAKARVVH